MCEKYVQTYGEGSLRGGVKEEMGRKGTLLLFLGRTFQRTAWLIRRVTARVIHAREERGCLCRQEDVDPPQMEG
jgi:hypothetical protein